jgi:hypothetical protein
MPLEELLHGSRQPAGRRPQAQLQATLAQGVRNASASPWLSGATTRQAPSGRLCWRPNGRVGDVEVRGAALFEALDLVVFVHGLLASSATWQMCAAGLAGRPAIAVDLPGFGTSTSRAFDQWRARPGPVAYLERAGSARGAGRNSSGAPRCSSGGSSDRFHAPRARRGGAGEGIALPVAILHAGGRAALAASRRFRLARGTGSSPTGARDRERDR